jgi:hypothetical protein
MFVGNERKIPVYKDELLTKLQANLLTHKEEFGKADLEWRNAARAFSEDLQERLTGGDFTNLSFDISRPVDSSKEIHRAISMIEMSVEEVITLDEPTFNQWVMGEWSFRNRLAEIGMMASAMTGALRKKG